jgi:hypothetical protein
MRWPQIRRRLRLRTAHLLVLSLLAMAGIVVIAVVVESAKSVGPPPVSAGPSVKHVQPVLPRFQRPEDHANGVYKPAGTTWPVPATVVVPVSAAKSPAGTTAAWVQSVLPGGPAKVQLSVLKHEAATAAGVSGVLFSATAMERSVSILFGI